VNENSAQSSGLAYLAPKTLYSCSKGLITPANNNDAIDCWQQEDLIETMKLVYYLDCQEKNKFESLVGLNYAGSVGGR